VNASFNETFTQSGGAGAITYTIETGTLPNGMTLASDGTLSGTPTQKGSFPIKVRATDAGGCFGISATYNLTIACQTITVTNPANTNGTVSSPFNETHWADPAFIRLIQQARAQLDQAKRSEILHEAQAIEYERGGYIIPYFSDQVDAYSTKLTGFVPAKSGFPLGNYWFKNVGYKA
jgi:ABC-type transport system substrate-binding protein